MAQDDDVVGSVEYNCDAADSNGKNRKHPAYRQWHMLFGLEGQDAQCDGEYT
jgi:hypothetical protein